MAITNMVAITNMDDTIDSRDIIERIEELEAERQELVDAVAEAAQAAQAFIDDPERPIGQMGDPFASLADARTALADAEQALTEWDHPDADGAHELATLKALAAQCERYAAVAVRARS